MSGARVVTHLLCENAKVARMDSGPIAVVDCARLSARFRTAASRLSTFSEGDPRGEPAWPRTVEAVALGRLLGEHGPNARCLLDGEARGGGPVIRLGVPGWHAVGVVGTLSLPDRYPAIPLGGWLDGADCFLVVIPAGMRAVHDSLREIPTWKPLRLRLGGCLAALGDSG